MAQIYHVNSQMHCSCLHCIKANKALADINPLKPTAERKDERQKAERVTPAILATYAEAKSADQKTASEAKALLHLMCQAPVEPAIAAVDPFTYTESVKGGVFQCVGLDFLHVVKTHGLAERLRATNLSYIAAQGKIKKSRGAKAAEEKGVSFGALQIMNARAAVPPAFNDGTRVHPQKTKGLTSDKRRSGADTHDELRTELIAMGSDTYVVQNATERNKSFQLSASYLRLINTLQRKRITPKAMAEIKKLLHAHRTNLPKVFPPEIYRKKIGNATPKDHMHEWDHVEFAIKHFGAPYGQGTDAVEARNKYVRVDYQLSSGPNLVYRMMVNGFYRSRIEALALHAMGLRVPLPACMVRRVRSEDGGDVWMKGKIRRGKAIADFEQALTIYGITGVKRTRLIAEIERLAGEGDGEVPWKETDYDTMVENGWLQAYPKVTLTTDEGLKFCWNVSPEAGNTRRHHLGQLRRVTVRRAGVDVMEEADDHLGDAPALRYPVLLFHVHKAAVGKKGNYVFLFGQRLSKETSMNGSEYMATRSLDAHWDVQPLGGVLRFVRNLPHFHGTQATAAEQAAALLHDPSLAGRHVLLRGNYMQTWGFVFCRIFRDTEEDGEDAPWYDTF